MNGKEIFEIRQNFKQPLKIVIRQNMGEGKYLDTAFSTEKVQLYIGCQKNSVVRFYYVIFKA